MSASATSLAMLLYQAMDSAVGIVVRCNDVAKCQMYLAQVKLKIGDPQLAVLSVRRSADLPNEEIWICKSGVIPAEEIEKKSQRYAEIDKIIGDLVSSVNN